MRKRRFFLAVIVVTAVSLAFYLFLGINYQKQYWEREYLSDRIAELNTSLHDGNSGDGGEQQGGNDLAKSLSLAKEQLVERQASFNVGLSNTDIINAIIQFARESQIESFSVRAASTTSEKV